ncbi:hypothetical protein TRP8649_03885 [Pelagimonas phthalicica]|uniref:Uncharacterized protein n=1 Tax=Pelagimonas phthalicica TaxID=1037362 RepID=A0A238JIW7_9RHOB|nr:hypothetical protein [Pelagimonas phthalicica]TDS89079.1 hypothetical protein CLV87_4268 [Pelagimonas phthalicica]SMX29746.1 hypothetical protein TRP8649_03885 [Pelagimonas phthalicica]
MKLFWLVTLSLLVIALLPAVVWIRAIAAGGDRVTTAIELKEFGPSSLQVLDEVLVSNSEASCANRDDAENCVRWKVPNGRSLPIYVEFITRQGVPILVIRSLPKYFLSIGPSYVGRSHKELEKFVVDALGDAVVSVERKKR